MKITFWGSTHGVTGSLTMLESGKDIFLIDCGMYQGEKEDTKFNWQDWPVSPKKITAIFLTHAHLDHCGLLPKMVREGFLGEIYATKETIGLVKIILKDSVKIIQNNEKNKKKLKGRIKGKFDKPLYQFEDVNLTFKKFKMIKWGKKLKVNNLLVEFKNAGHILGASMIKISDGNQSILFSGDLGRQDDILMWPPTPIDDVDYVVMESTYGDRIRSGDDPIKLLKDNIKHIIKNKSVLLIPSFAMARTQNILFFLYELFQKNPNLKIPVYVDSPMGTELTKIYEYFSKINKSEEKFKENYLSEVFSLASFVKNNEYSKKLDTKFGPFILMASSGMLTGGRVLRHFKFFGENEDNLIMLAGFQAPGTLGRKISEGDKEVEVENETISVKATISNTDIFSSHADQKELVNWILSIKKDPKKIFLIHGDLTSKNILKKEIDSRLKSQIVIPSAGDTFDL